jgi:hypothetical protein
MKRTFTLADFQRWGRAGGKKSRRTLTTEQSLAMLRAKQKKQKTK